MEDDAFRRMLDQLEARLAVTEYDFPSSAPVIGPIVGAVRRWWNNISTRWYVRHYAQQQAAINLAVLEVLRLTHIRYEQLARSVDQRDQEWSGTIERLAQDDLQRGQELAARIDGQQRLLRLVQDLIERDLHALVRHAQDQ